MSIRRTGSIGTVPPTPEWNPNDTPPVYADVADLVDNEVDFMLEIRRLQGQPLFVGVSVVDSVLQLKERIQKVQLDAHPESQLIRNKDGKFLPNAMGLGEAGLDADSVVALFIRPEGADVFGPEIDNVGGAAAAAVDEVDGPGLATFKAEEVSEMMLPAPKAFTRAITGSLVVSEGVADGTEAEGGPSGVSRRARRSEVEADDTDIEDGLDLESSRNVGDGFASILPGAGESNSATKLLRPRGEGVDAHGLADPPSSSESDSGSDSSLPPTYSYLDARRDTAADLPQISGGKRLLLTLLGGFFYIIFAGLFIAAPTAMIVVGQQKKDECPSKDRLPTWMMTQGIISVVWVVLLIVSKKLKGKMEDALQLQYGDHLARDDIVRMADAQFQNERRSLSQIYNLVQGFGLIWFIMGSIWVFGCQNCKMPYNVSMGNVMDAGCDQTAFKLAYWFLLSVYIVSAMPFVIFFLWVCGFCVFNQPGNQAEQRVNVAAQAQAPLQ